MPVIMVTGSMPPQQVHERLPHLHAVVAKPFTMHELKQAVDLALDDSATSGPAPATRARHRR